MMMLKRALVLSLALVGCDGKPAPAAGAKAKVDAKAPPVVNDAEEADLIAKAPPEGEVADAATSVSDAAGIHHIAVKMLDGTTTKLDAYKGKALLVVNTASECGYTPQYEDLQKLYATYKDRGLEVLAFPSNDYGGQEPGTPDEIRKFVDENFNVEFPMFDKVVVKGPDKAPLYKTLTEDAPSDMQGEVKWNFTKFLIDTDGKVIGRFEAKVKPTDPEITAAIEKALPAGT